MEGSRIFLLLVVLTSYQCSSLPNTERYNHLNIESHEESLNYDKTSPSIAPSEDLVRAIWKNDKGKSPPNPPKEEKHEDRDIFMHHKLSYFNLPQQTHGLHDYPPTAAPAAVHKETKTLWNKKEKNDDLEPKKVLPTEKPYPTAAQKETKKFWNKKKKYDDSEMKKVLPAEKQYPTAISKVKPEKQKPQEYKEVDPYLDVKSSDDYSEESEYDDISSNEDADEEVKNLLPIKILNTKDEIKDNDKDTLVLVVKVPKLSSLSLKDKIKLPSITLDLGKHKAFPKLTSKLKTPVIVPIEKPVKWETSIVHHKEKEIKKPSHALHPVVKPELSYKPEAVSPNHFVKPMHTAPTHKPVQQDWHHKPVHYDWTHRPEHMNWDDTAEYLHLDDKPVLLFDAPVKDMSHIKGPIDFDSLPDGQWIRLRRNSEPAADKFSDAIDRGQVNPKSKYRGELPPLEFPEMVKQKPKVKHLREIDAPFYFPETDDTILNLVLDDRRHKGEAMGGKEAKASSNKGNTRLTVAPEYADLVLQNGDETDAPLLFPSNVQLVSESDDYKKYVPPTYFPETEAELDYQFEIRPFQKGSIFDRSNIRTTTEQSNPPKAEESEEHDGHKLKKMLSMEDNFIDDNEIDSSYAEPKPKPTKSDLLRVNEIQSRSRIGAHYKTDLETGKHRQHHRKYTNNHI